VSDTDDPNELFVCFHSRCHPSRKFSLQAYIDFNNPIVFPLIIHFVSRLHRCTIRNYWGGNRVDSLSSWLPTLSMSSWATP